MSVNVSAVLEPAAYVLMFIEGVSNTGVEIMYVH